MVVGITGSIASGKSLVTTYLKKNNYIVIDCDEISHNVLQIEDVKNQLINIFSKEIIVNDAIDRKVLGRIVFNDHTKKRSLEEITFPYILNEIKNQLNLYQGLVFLDAPLLIEYNLQYLVDKIIVIDISKENQIERLMKRDNISKDYAIIKIESQLSLEEKKKYSDFIIDNNQNIEYTYNQLKQIIKKLEV